MIKDYNVPLDTEQRAKIHKAIESRGSLAEITHKITTYRVVEYLLEDKPLLEKYLTDMAGLFTKQRQQASYRALIKSIFHTRRCLPHYNKDFLAILTKVIDREREIQWRVFVAENHLQAVIHKDLWKIYERHGDVLRLNSMDFSKIKCVSLRYELKHYHRYLIELSGKAAVSLFHSHVMALNALTEINPRIKYFSDITEADARALLIFLENACGKKSGAPLSQNYIATAAGGVRRVIEYLMSERRNNEIKAPKPYVNPLANLAFRNMIDFATPTSAIPEDVIEQINNHSEELAPLYKLIYDIFTNTGLRLKEVFFLESGCVESSRYSDICQLKFKPYKTLAARRRFFGFWTEEFAAAGLYKCDEFAAAAFYKYLEESSLAEYTKSGTWSSVNMFFKTMNGWDDVSLKNPFALAPYKEQKKFDNKYIPEIVASQLDKIFKSEEIVLHLRCAYWIFRLIPSRVSEVIGMGVDCLKRYNGNYVVFIPTWKQNGGWREPIMRSIHMEETGIAAYLIGLIKEQREAARRLQEHMPAHQQGALFTYRQRFERKGQLPYVSNQYRVFTKDIIRRAFHDVCAKYNVVNKEGNIYKLTSHQFRHNGITDRLAAGFTAAQIAEMTGHHGSAMIFNAYAHLNLLPETIIQKQEYVSGEADDRENRYILFGGRILNMEEQLEKRLLRNLRAHRVRGGICSDITGCKSDMWNCLDCEFFVPDAEQVGYYQEQAVLWREKCVRFSNFPIIKGNAEKNAELFERVLKKLKGGEYSL